MVGNLPANAGDTGSCPGPGGSHMPRSNWAREPQLLSLRVWSLCSATGEAATVRGPRTAMKSGPHSPQLEKALAQKRRPNTAKNKFKKKNKEIDICAFNSHFSDFTSFYMYSFVRCVCVVFYEIFLTCIDSCNHPTDLFLTVLLRYNLHIIQFTHLCIQFNGV